MSDLFIQVLAYFVVVVLMIIFFNFLLNGLLWPYFKVKASRGKKVLIKVRNPVIDYYAVGIPEGKRIKTKFNDKKERILSVENNSYYRSLGVICLDVDEETGAIVTRDYKLQSSYDHVHFSDLLKRAISAPSSQENLQKVIIVLIVVVLIGLIVIGVKVYGLENSIQLIGTISSGNIPVGGV